LQSVYEGDHVTPDVKTKGGKPLVGGNMQAHLDALRKDMMKAAENLEFEEAARLRDEVKRLEAVDLAISDDPMARQSAVEAASAQPGKAGQAKARSTSGRPGTRTYRGKSNRKN
ncbi:MAG: UvrB/UvrC motif-containing protein, partial [Pseudomonadota bacterium]